jgi:glycosyltransferase involved in cell wall biosynthesis
VKISSEFLVLKEPGCTGVKLSLILPAYNAADFIGGSLGRVCHYLDGLKMSYEVIVVDDGSIDATSDRILRINVPAIGLYRFKNNKGKGAAVKLGMLLAKGEYRILTDCDLPYSLDTIERMLFVMGNEGIDVCLGNRHIKGSVISQRVRFSRKIISFVSRALLICLLRIRDADPQCGIKGFNRRSAEHIFSLLTVERFAFDVEVLYIAKLFQYRTKSIPVTMSEEYSVKSTVSLSKDLARAFKDLLRIRLNELRNLYHTRDRSHHFH